MWLAAAVSLWRDEAPERDAVRVNVQLSVTLQCTSLYFSDRKSQFLFSGFSFKNEKIKNYSSFFVYQSLYIRRMKDRFIHLLCIKSIFISDRLTRNLKEGREKFADFFLFIPEIWIHDFCLPLSSLLLLIFISFHFPLCPSLILQLYSSTPSPPPLCILHQTPRNLFSPHSCSQAVSPIITMHVHTGVTHAYTHTHTQQSNITPTFA